MPDIGNRLQLGIICEKWLIGLKNGGQHLKQEHATEKETEMSSDGAQLILKNSFRMRDDFCKLFNYFLKSQ